jgi:hypothetical protein
MANDRETLRKNGFPPELKITAEVMNSLSKEQNKVLSRFSDAAKSYNLILKKKDLCQTGKPNAAGLISFPDENFLVCRNDADRKEAIKKFQEDLKEPKEIIIFILNEALDCELGHLDIVQKNCQIFKVKP